MEEIVQVSIRQEIEHRYGFKQHTIRHSNQLKACE